MWNRNAIGSRIAFVATALLITSIASLADSTSHDAMPAESHYFGVEIEGRPIGGFSSVSGLSAETEVVEYRSGSEDTLVRKLPGRLKFSNIVIRRPYVGDDVLHEWIRETFTPGGEVVRRNGAVIIRNRAGDELVRYRFYDGWPCKWTGPGDDPESSKLTMEEVVICIEWFDEA